MAIRIVSPETPNGIQAAVDASSEGDVVVVECGVYHQAVTVKTSYLRIVAKHKHCAILDGFNTLSTAFTLEGTTGVEIDGFKIRNYHDYGINFIDADQTQDAGYNRIVENRIKDITNGPGIAIEIGTTSFGNLFWKNHIKRTGTSAIYIGSDNNRVIENSLHHNPIAGVYIADSGNNAIVNNHLFENAYYGVLNSGINNLILDNRMTNNGYAGEESDWISSVIIGNQIERNVGYGVDAFTNDFIANNEIKCNGQSGVLVTGSFVDVQENEIEGNQNNGIYVKPTANSTFIFRNDVDHNTPYQIKDFGINTVKLQNETKD